MTVYEFTNAVTRAADDETPLFFEWPRTGVEPAVQVAFDNINFTAISGTVTEKSLAGDNPRYMIAYNAADRLSSPGIITYKITEGGDTVYLEVHITSPQKPPEAVDVASLASLIESVGPRRVKTEGIEVEAHPIDKMQKVQERQGPKVIGLGNIRKDRVVPKGNWWCQ